MSLASLSRHGLLATADVDTEPAEPVTRSLEVALYRVVEFAGPGPGGCAIVRLMTGDVFVGDGFDEFGAVRITLFGSRQVRAWQRAEVLSVGILDCSLAELREISRRQRHGDPALTMPLTDRERAQRKRAPYAGFRNDR